MCSFFKYANQRGDKTALLSEPSTSRETETDREGHGVVVPLWYEGATDLSIGGREQVDTAYGGHRILSPIRIAGWRVMLR